MIHLYEKDRFIVSLNYELEEFKNNPFVFYPEWNPSNMLATEVKYENPIIDKETQELREMNKYEQYVNGLYELQNREVVYKGTIIELQEGEYLDELGEIVKIEKINGYRVEWNWDKHIWEEKSTPEERLKAWYEMINSWKPKVLEGPFSYKHRDGKIYKQKLRVGKDDTLLSTAIQALIRHADIPSVEWAFDDENNSIDMTLEDLRKLQDTGFVWTQCVYEAERDLKAMMPDFKKDESYFKELAISHIASYKIA